MKKLLLLILVCFGLSMVCGCFGASTTSPVGNGMIFTRVKGPVMAPGQGIGSLEGRAECRNVLGFVAVGDASIKAAAQNGGITKIMAVDYEAFSVMGVFSRFTTVVYGE